MSRPTRRSGRWPSRAAPALAGVAIAAAVHPGPADAQQPVPGFKVTLVAEGAESSPECYVSARTLNCSFVGRLPSGASCDEGGAVPVVRLSRRGRPRQTYVCMDEGFHDWQVLPRGRTWRSGGFTCRTRWIGGDLGYARLTCRNKRHGFHVLPTGKWKIAR